MKKNITTLTRFTLIFSVLTTQQFLNCKYNSALHKQAKKSEARPCNPHPSKLVKDMNEEELKSMLTYAKITDNKELVFKVFHFLMTVSTSQDNLKEYKLDLANYCYQLKDFEKASFVYEEFCSLYPGSQEMEYAQYKSILCWFFLSLDPSKDQTFTHKTILLIDTFLQTAKNKKFIDESNSIKQTCRKKLLEHEVHVFEHYCKQRKFTGAQKRLDYIKESFSDIEHIKEYIVYLEKMFDVSKNPKRPFTFSITLQDALHSNEQSKKAKSAEKKQKSALYFLA